MSFIYQKSDFYNAAMAHLSDYPQLATRLAAGDVTITQQIGAIAQMLAMMSYQIGLAEVEPWIKARDNMVLADAAARGILPFGKAAIYQANIINHSNQTYHITAGRRLLDNSNRVWTVQNGTSIAAGQTASVQIEQYEIRQTIHTVVEAQPFYRIALNAPSGYLLDVEIVHADGGLFRRAVDFHNVTAGERAYHVISDETMQVAAQFGVSYLAGYTPVTGEKLTVRTRHTDGNVRLQSATPLDLEYTRAGEEALEILSGSLIAAGAAPPDIDTLREITNYPSLYDSNAVFVGEFNFLLQRQMQPFVFLNVWNELREEQARGANVENINTLFVSFVKDGIAADEAKTQITRIIQAADDSYRVRFVAPKETQIPVSVHLALAPMHDEAAVSQKVKLYLLERYGRGSAWARKGGQRINWQNTVKGLRDSIAELQDGVSDVSVSINETQKRQPENFRYVSETSLTIASEKL